MLCSREEGPPAAWWQAGQGRQQRAGCWAGSPPLWLLRTQTESQPGPPRPRLGEQGDHQAWQQDPQSPPDGTWGVQVCVWV